MRVSVALFCCLGLSLFVLSQLPSANGALAAQWPCDDPDAAQMNADGAFLCDDRLRALQDAAEGVPGDALVVVADIYERFLYEKTWACQDAATPIAERKHHHPRETLAERSAREAATWVRRMQRKCSVLMRMEPAIAPFYDRILGQIPDLGDGYAFAVLEEDGDYPPKLTPRTMGIFGDLATCERFERMMRGEGFPTRTCRRIPWQELEDMEGVQEPLWRDTGLLPFQLVPRPVRT